MATLIVPSYNSRLRDKQKKKYSAQYPICTVIGPDEGLLNDQFTTQSPLSETEEGKHIGGATKTDTKPKSLFYDEWSQLPPDPRGAELGREARVWKVYVGETEKWDNELLEGWEKSLDVLLVFVSAHIYKAALLSAIIATFLVESSNMLKEDPNEVSATALVAISQALTALTTNNSSAAPSGLPSPDQNNSSNFVPSKIDIWINALWYSSFSLSIATAFMAMLAKDWCYSFKAKRTGHPYDQAHRRQRKWKMIQRCGMQEVIEALPSLMHLSLFLFCIGLYLYLLDLNNIVAILVMYIGGTFIAFYILTSITATFVEYFPYTTVISRILRSQYMQNIYKYISKSRIPYTVMLMVNTIRLLIMGITFVSYWSMVWLFSWPAHLLLTTIVKVNRCFVKRFSKEQTATNGFADKITRIFQEIYNYLLILPFKLDACYSDVKSQIARKAKRFDLAEELTTVLALRWLINHCETPSAVNIALQAISGARKEMPNGPLRSCQAAQHITSRIVSEGDKDGLYARGLEFLGWASKTDLIDDEQSSDEDWVEEEWPKQEALEQEGIENERRENANQENHKQNLKDHETQEQWEKGKPSEDIIHVMFWDLNSRNERKVLNRLGDKTFVPNSTNIEAMTLGNAAVLHSLNAVTSHKLRIIPSQNADPRSVIERIDISQKLIPITKLFSAHLQSKNKLLHPAAVQSLANATVLYASLSAISGCELPSELAMHCIRFCQQFSKKTTSKSATRLKHEIETGAVFMICILIQGQTSPKKTMDIVKYHNLAICTAKILTKLYGDHSISPEDIFLVGCSKVLSGANNYYLNDTMSSRVALSKWCSDQTTSFIRTWGPSTLEVWSSAHRPAKEMRSKFLKAVSKVYRLHEALNPDGLEPTCLPGSTYVILIMIAICSRPGSPQSRSCSKLLSRFDFPKQSPELTKYLKESVEDNTNETVLSTLRGAYTSKKNSSQQPFAATQLWLLLDCFEGSEDEEYLMDQIKLVVETQTTDNVSWSQVKQSFGEFILSKYKTICGTSSALNCDGKAFRPTEALNILDPNIQAQQTGDAIGNFVLQFGDGSRRFETANTKDYERTYVARVAESILGKLDMGEGQHAGLKDAIEADLKGLPNYLRTRVTPGEEIIKEPVQDELEIPVLSVMQTMDDSTDVGHVSLSIGSNK
ncbi:hypothetical protein RhiXN_10076 [Rhizoctonia solani]|uniref:DUF6535 domain-containing protein n=1 Tax=Rhizoctonia solani TaxID=456999 RepID=A0A8H8NYW1_9AGAM|nr:uncharacterized protein RhiXN_10076 [Rhizoctonia solani]QRW22489.1 hypothetical protein RhiXN_10076 [Rhizoctonia solani]